jgi:hypothetical protein
LRDGKRDDMEAPWLIWSFIPGLHWLAWIQAGILARYPWYYVIGVVYALPFLGWFVSKRFPLSFFLLSWVLGLLHAQLHKPDINQRIANAAAASTREPLRQALLQAALKHRGALSVTLGVLETGKSFPEVERVLNDMVASGYVSVRSNPETGVVEYVFRELL